MLVACDFVDQQRSQQNQRNAVLVLMQDIQCLLPVSRLHDLIVIGEYFAQERPVERVIFYN